MPAAPATTASGRGRRSWPSWPPGPGWQITICRFPPGTPKRNKIEHRLCCRITRTWRARPLASHQVITGTIAAAAAAAGLTVTAAPDTGSYPPGAGVSHEQMKDPQDRVITRHAFHRGWNYTLPAVPRPAAPAPAPAPPAASPWPEILTDPALTGMTRADLDALAAALEPPSAAAREQRLHLARGKPRASNPRPQGRPAHPHRRPGRRHRPAAPRHAPPPPGPATRRRRIPHQPRHPPHHPPAGTARTRHHPRRAPHRQPR
jgi:Rhodopirellula transposase DDE domain